MVVLSHIDHLHVIRHATTHVPCPPPRPFTAPRTLRQVWQLLGRWMAGNGDHPNHKRGWDDVHPASPTRQIAALQLSGNSDYRTDGTPPRRGVSAQALCRVCFQPGKDVVVPVR